MGQTGISRRLPARRIELTSGPASDPRDEIGRVNPNGGDKRTLNEAGSFWSRSRPPLRRQPRLLLLPQNRPLDRRSAAVPPYFLLPTWYLCANLTVETKTARSPGSSPAGRLPTSTCTGPNNIGNGEVAGSRSPRIMHLALKLIS